MKLKTISLNVGYNVMKNVVKGSEAAFVKLCQSKAAACSSNSARLVSGYDLILLQEVSAAQWPRFLAEVQSYGKKRKANYQALVSYYFGDWITAIIYDENVLGTGIQVTPAHFELYEATSVKKTGSRGIIVVWFEKLELIAINLHAPHDVNLIEMIETRLKASEPFLHQLKLNDNKIKKVLIGGDFNDDQGLLLKPGAVIKAYGKEVRLPVNPNSVPQTCCYDSNYQFKGDYLLINRSHDLNTNKGEYFGWPMGYQRGVHLYSDHDPIVLIVDLSFKESKSQAISQPAKITSLDGMLLRGRVKTSGNYVEIQFPQFNQDQLVELARDYVKAKGLNWQVRKPHAWTDYNSMPHVTLHPSMKKYYGEEVDVKFGKIYHFIGGNSRWVVAHAELPSKFQCEYGCHLSIGQQRIR